MIITGDKEFYKGVSKINYEGKESDNPFAYKYYNPDQLVWAKQCGSILSLLLLTGIACGQGADPFGPGTQKFPWDQSNDPLQRARDKADAAFELITKLGFDYFCFHDVDLVDEADNLIETEKRLHKMLIIFLKRKRIQV